MDDRQGDAFRAYPNPTANSLHVAVPPGLGPGVLRLFDIDGKLRVSINLAEDCSEYEVKIPSPGLYLLRVEGKTGQYLKKIVAE